MGVRKNSVCSCVMGNFQTVPCVQEGQYFEFFEEYFPRLSCGIYFSICHSLCCTVDTRELWCHMLWRKNDTEKLSNTARLETGDNGKFENKKFEKYVKSQIIYVSLYNVEHLPQFCHNLAENIQIIISCSPYFILTKINRTPEQSSFSFTLFACHSHRHLVDVALRWKDGQMHTFYLFWGSYF
jgi:hypothetical protein